VEVDVAIIGAGPAGSTLAALLAQRGANVTLYDRESFPRDKLCGEFLSYDALQILDAMGALQTIDAQRVPAIEQCRIIGRRRTYTFALPKPARGVSRMLLDHTLLNKAKSNGARFEVETVANLNAVNAKIVVGAWGRWGRFDKELHRSFVEEKDRSFGFKRHYRKAANRHLSTGTNQIDLYSFEHGYLGVNAIEGHETNICGLVHASRLAGHKGRWDAFVETIRNEEPQLEALYARYEPAQEHFLASEPVIFRARSAVEGGVFMIGDASGIIDPLTGNGMAMAIQSALLAAPLLLRLLESPAQRTTIEDEYRSAHHRFFAPRIAWSRGAARLLSRPRLIDAALATVRTPKIGELFLRKTRASAESIERMAAAWF
jgi:flavin-dependent dehydrogenase